MTTRHKSAIALAILATTPLLLNGLFVQAQDMPKPNGPIDVQADEQEFAPGRVIARGKVRVIYGDTTVRAPMATLFRDEAGSPKQAIFTGNPVLSQGSNMIRATKLTFNVKEARIIAEGRAHSEVTTTAMASAAPPSGGAQAASAKSKTKGAKPKPVVSVEATDTTGGETAAGGDSNAGGSEELSASSENADASKENLPAGKDEFAGKEKKPFAEKPPQRIITDADKQEFDRNTGRFEAIGHVHVRTGDIDVDANHLKLVYGTDNKPEAVVFTGDVSARTDRNETHADVMTYFLTTQRMQATGHVRSRVVQEKASAASDPSSPTAAAAPLTGMNNSILGGDAAYAASPKKDSLFDMAGSGGSEVLTIVSDSQDYNKESGRIDADGNVRLYYKETTGISPKITVVNNEYGQADRVIFMGRSQISQPGRRWIGDRITMVVADRKVLAEGNTRAIIVKVPPKPPDYSNLRQNIAPPPPKHEENNSRLARGRKMTKEIAGENKTR